MPNSRPLPSLTNSHPLSFVNISHPDDIRRSLTRHSVRCHAMRVAGKARRKHPRHVVVDLEYVSHPQGLPSRKPPNANQPGMDLTKARVVQDTGTQGIASDLPPDKISLGPSWSVNSHGITGVELDARALQLLQFCKCPGPARMSSS